MPFKTIKALQKVASLDGEVVSLAPYLPGNVCAAFSTDPVRLAVIPFGGGAPKLQSLSLDACHEGALIDERVAVLRVGEELWAVLDVQHKPRVEPVGRSARNLFNNPGSNGALVLDWSGDGTELKLEGHEVSGRTFPLRGAVRSCSLDGRHCFVVADDGGGGGRLREHDGNTPESGTQLRCDLPLAAKSMTRFAGGAQLSALARPGGVEVCVVRKVGAAALEARVMSVGAPVADIAVMESTLFVASVDGTLRGFGGDVLQRTGDGGRPTPTFEVSLGVGVVPTVVAVSSRGGNRIWIGTKEGDVLRGDALKGALLSA